MSYENYDEKIIIVEPQKPALTYLAWIYIGINLFFSIILALYVFKTVFNPPSLMGKIGNVFLYLIFFPIYMIKYIFECQRKN